MAIKEPDNKHTASKREQVDLADGANLLIVLLREQIAA